MRCKVRVVFYAVTYCAFAFVILRLQVSFSRAIFSRFDLYYDSFLLDLPGCKFPSYSASHWTLRLLSPWRQATTSWSCRGTSIVYMNGSVLALDEHQLYEQYGVSRKKLLCSYHEVIRQEGMHPDKNYQKGPQLSVRFGEALRGEYVQVSCAVNSTVFFKEYFLIPRKKKVSPILSPGQLSVLVLGLDSTSRLNSYRRLKKTRLYLKRELNAFEFLGYNKVGDNSFPNQMPLLSGLSGPTVHSIYQDTYFDSLPHLWSAFKSRGYTTLFLEEMAHAGLFEFPNLYGFKNPPADYYPRPVTLSLELEYANCVGSRPKTVIYLDYVRDVLRMTEKIFAYVWITDVPHEDHTRLGILDDPLEHFLRELVSLGIMDRTALFFLSDHGVRYGSTRLMEAGRHEDLTPFSFLTIPAWFLRQHPQAAVHLEVNQRRLITAYDFHATLLSLADLPSLSTRRTSKGISLLGAVPPQRTCADAFVPGHFCACLGSRKPVDNTAQAKELGQFCLAYINKQAEAHFPQLCHQWSLKAVDEAEILGGDVVGKVMFRLRLTTVPTAHFEVYGTIVKPSRKIEFVQRLDKYSNGTKCLPESRWQNLCMCK